jgi:hypothetical protein
MLLSRVHIESFSHRILSELQYFLHYGIREAVGLISSRNFENNIFSVIRVLVARQFSWDRVLFALSFARHFGRALFQ